MSGLDAVKPGKTDQPYPLICITESALMRGIDPRVKAKVLKVIIAKSFASDEDYDQAINRSARAGDDGEVGIF